MEGAAQGGVLVVIERGQHDVVADEGSVADRDAALVLETASGVYEDAGPDAGVQAEVGGEGEMGGEARIDLRSRQPREVLADLIGCAHCGVHLLIEEACASADFVHELQHPAAGRQRPARGDVSAVFLDRDHFNLRRPSDHLSYTTAVRTRALQRLEPALLRQPGFHDKRLYSGRRPGR